MSDVALTTEVLPLEERGWRLAVLRELVLFCLSTARVIYRDINQPFGTERRRDMSSWPAMVGRLARMIGQFERLMELVRRGVAPAAEMKRARIPVPERRPRAHRSEPCWGRFTLFDAGVPGAEPWRASLGYVLAERDVAALMAVDPRAARLVRSMCRLFGLRPEDVLYPTAREPDEVAVVISTAAGAAYGAVNPFAERALGAPPAVEVLGSG